MAVYVTGDTHGFFDRLFGFPFEENDTLIVLGDAGINVDGGARDRTFKLDVTEHIKCNVFCIHGNHEQRPSELDCYQLVDYCGGKAWVDPEFPRLIFAKDGESYDIENRNFFVIGGAYSVDKYYRLKRGWMWFENEQPSEEIKKYVEDNLERRNYCVDVILTHTSPFDYRPTHLFLECVDQSTVDSSTEEWLQSIENKLNYNEWLFGHYHGDEQISPNIRMLYHDVYQVC